MFVGCVINRINYGNWSRKVEIKIEQISGTKVRYVHTHSYWHSQTKRNCSMKKLFFVILLAYWNNALLWEKIYSLDLSLNSLVAGDNFNF